jgi:hypothetical protein
LVDELVILKEKLAIASGGTPTPPSTQTDSKKGEVAVPQPVSATAPAFQHHAPIVRPQYVSAGPKVAASAKLAESQAPPLAAVIVGDSIDLTVLEARLVVFSYVGGYVPSKSDSRVYSILSEKGGLRYPNTARWMRHMSSFADEERAAWK